MKLETLRDVVLALPCDGATSLAMLGALSPNLLDATVYRSCPECGGSGSVTGAEDFPGGDEGYDVTNSPCPACADNPTAIVEVALRDRAWQTAVDYAGDTYGMDLTRAADARIVDAVLSVVLPRVRWAKAVGTLSIEHVGDGRPIAMLIGSGGKTLGTARTGDCVAILEKEK